MSPVPRRLIALPDDEAFRRLVDSVHDYAIFMLTPDGVIASWNAGAERIKGYAASEAIGSHFSMFYTPEALASGWPDEELRRAAAVGRFEDEGWRVRKDGTRFWANAVLSALRGSQGELLGFAKVTRDLTERRAHESRVQESERSLRLLIDTVQDYAIFALDTEGYITSWNLGAQRIKGYTAEEAVGRHFSMFYEDDAIARGWPAEELARARSLGRYEDEGWRRRKDGERIWANVVITAIVGEDGVLRGFSKVTRDLTERRRQEEALREREENLRLLVEGVRDHAMFLVDPVGRIRTWNGGAQQVFGYASDEAIGRDAGMLFTGEDQQARRPATELVAARRAGFHQQEAWRQRADGSQFWADVATTLLRDPDGQTRGYAHIVRDLTERKRVEALENEGRRITEFIAMLSHELRNPLAPIRNAVAILRRTTQSAEAAWSSDVIGRQVEHMSHLVDDLLDVSRVTSGKIRLELSPTELNTLVRMAVDAARPGVEKPGHVLALRLGPEPVVLLADATRLTQVVTNLLTNAAKYTPAPGRIDVSVEAENQVATLQVRDNGIGMAPPLRQRAFDPFVQGARGSDRAEGGLGIGLTLVKHIVELHGGSVGVHSAGVGLGCTFTVTLPLVGSSGSQPALRDPAPAPPAAAAAGVRVLVVDDNRDSADSLALLVGLGGHEVRVAHDGPGALEVAAAFQPAVVLMDIGLPGMDGNEVARRMRAMPALGGTRLIAITGYGQVGDRQATAAAGFERHLTKPVDTDLLLDLLG